MTHVSEQIVDAIVTALKPLPELGERVYRRGALGWDRRSFPMVVVNAGATTIATNQSGSRRSHRLQDRRQTFVVEIHDLEEEGLDPSERPSRIAVAIETAMSAFHAAVPIDDCVLTADTGLTEIDEDADGAHVAQALTFAITYHTVEGDPSAMLEPNR